MATVWHERPSDKDETKIVKVGNYLNTSLISSQTKLNNLGVAPIVIGDGSVVIDQYPKKNTKISQKSKVFLVTNGKNVVAPNMVGWSSSEITSYAKLLGIPYEINGYGYVVSTNINEGDIIDVSTSKIVATLSNLEAGSLVTEGELT